MATRSEIQIFLKKLLGENCEQKNFNFAELVEIVKATVDHFGRPLIGIRREVKPKKEQLGTITQIKKHEPKMVRVSTVRIGPAAKQKSSVKASTKAKKDSHVKEKTAAHKKNPKK
jgi:hypothetical protein